MAMKMHLCCHEPVLPRPRSTIRDVIEALVQTRLDAVPVVNGRCEVVGVMTKHNLYRALLDGYSLDSEIMGLVTSPAVCVGENLGFEEIYRVMAGAGVGQVVVVDRENRPVGMVTKVNLIENLKTRSDLLAGELTSLLNALENGVVAVNEQGTVTLVNPAGEQMLGVKSVVGRPVDEALPQLNMGMALEGKTEENWHKIAVEGQHLLARYSPVKRGGESGGAIAVLHDLTGYEQIAQELESVKKLQQTLSTVLELAYDGILVVDREGIITTANRAFTELLGVGPAELVGRRVSEALPELALEEILQSGVTDLGDMLTLGGKQCMVGRIPMIRDDVVEGAVAKVVFRGLKRFQDLARKLSTLENQLSYYRDELSRITDSDLAVDDIIGHGAAIMRVKEETARAAGGPSTILLLGESGTGKDLFARAIHSESRRMGPFIKVNCAAIPDSLLESEFFGYEGGAFTGARKGGKPGKFELADGGTLFLDEIGDMSHHLQAKLLRVLQEREFERVGGTRTVRVNVRIIAATNRDLWQLVKEGKFREDLYYRLNVICLRIPSLRERVEDIRSLTAHLIRKFNGILGTRVRGVSPDALEVLTEYGWPGNVRELENVIERAMNLNSEGVILPAHLPEYMRERQKSVSPPAIEVNGGIRYAPELARAERELIMRALTESGGNRTRAAEFLGISRACLYDKLKRHNIRYKQ